MAMENRLATRREGAAPGSNLPRAGGVAEDNDNEDEKVYYGFGVFMGMSLSDLKAMKDEFVEQQAMTGGAPRRNLPPSAVVDGRAHRVEDDGNGYEHQEDVRMALPHAQQQQQRMNGFNGQRGGEGQSREFAGERARYGQEAPDAEMEEDADSDGSDEFGKSHSLNFILH
ncbi:uncharacterized protein PITG_12164 [Phytophthora infestans T30-4]|uniref:Uncharacterized protein n=2 Tax=Phytophthora infestans TaxID=4787 RepID=D0NJ73_PHYIT|nr:uncharacterized protein PITG_12164 [Phytophthora infestans T30-4]EEY59591.1 conserved hypothetical protein [Phytophthora infestans T30-4]KAF4035639.1 hypothetical protein GN244_ATG12305 [Phytophthora infestans]KAF4134619.1 hypothetical protein GN958_ATG16166 [Phytophthora infestans]KAI9999260.1 hypothetical protein PInf_004080 [Phytophthora infestans]|eukprot:XP_002900784.1 conserved hypothetical protein [Phytophthora infestans T30-4]